MSIETTLQALADLLEQSDPAFVKVYARPKEATAPSEFPCCILALDPSSDHTWNLEASGLGRHDYTIAGYILLGPRSAPLPDLHDRVLPWPRAIADLLFANIALGGAVQNIGSNGSDQIVRYRAGPIQWANGTYWGIRFWLPVTEKHAMETAP